MRTGVPVDLRSVQKTETIPQQLRRILLMKQWIVEDWAFEITVAQAQPCRLDFEKGDRFNCKYECPAGFCPKTIPDSIPCAELYAAAEIHKRA